MREEITAGIKKDFANFVIDTVAEFGGSKDDVKKYSLKLCKNIVNLYRNLENGKSSLQKSELYTTNDLRKEIAAGNYSKNSRFVAEALWKAKNDLKDDKTYENIDEQIRKFPYELYAQIDKILHKSIMYHVKPQNTDLSEEIKKLREQVKISQWNEQKELLQRIARLTLLQKREAELDAKKERLEKICNQNDARKQIAKIALGILKKNAGQVNRHAGIAATLKRLTGKLEDTDRAIKILNERIPHYSKRPIARQPKFKMLPGVRQNRTISAERSEGILAILIADVMDGDKFASQLVAYSGSLEIDGLSATMSDNAKQEIKSKNLARTI